MNRQFNLMIPSGTKRDRVSRSLAYVRRGTSLIETIVTISVASTLLLLATAWIHQSFFISSKMRDGRLHLRY